MSTVSYLQFEYNEEKKAFSKQGSLRIATEKRTPSATVFFEKKSGKTAF